jgi:hypothetical protein
MAVTNLLTRNNVNLQTGPNSYGPFARPANMLGFQIVMGFFTTATPTNWPNATTTAQIFIQYSYDGGNTWSPPEDNNAGPMAGGIHTDKVGAQVPQWEVGFQMNPLPTHIQGNIEVVGGPLRTSMQVNAYN